MAGVPWYYDETCQAYRVRRGFKFPGLEITKPESESDSDQAMLAAGTKTSEPSVRKLILEGEAFLDSLRKFLKTLKS